LRLCVFAFDYTSNKKIKALNNLFDFILRYISWFVFLICEIISLVLLFTYNNYQGSIWMSSANVVTGKVYEVNAGVEQFFSLTDINEQLSKRNLYLEQRVQDLTSQIAAQTGDSSLMKLENYELMKKFNLISAKVVSNSINKRNNLITIDKGEIDGVRKDMGVACGSGVVGIVFMTGRHYSVVMPILNSNSSISCTINKRGYFGYLHWTGGNSRIAFMDEVPRHAHFNLYDKVVTSGYSSVFPPGIEIGKIIHVYNSSDGLSYRCMVELSTNFAKLRDVSVIDDAQMKERIDILRAAQDSLEKK
jgi:rod shape-determining protein MreC